MRLSEVELVPTEHFFSGNEVIQRKNMVSGFDAWRIFRIYEKQGDLDPGLGLIGNLTKLFYIWMDSLGPWLEFRERS